ncbi:MAG: carboxypeptidase regulatory-like domain-containing protein, partial [Terracidiphilus sp.]
MSFIVRTWIACTMGLLLCVTLFSLPARGQAAKGVITGAVEDISGSALKGAQLKLLPLGAQVATDDQGQFTFLAVPAGTYTISASYVGFKPAEKAVQVTANQVQNVDIKLGVASMGESILVTAERAHGEAESINETRTADNILQVLPVEVIVSLPNANAADAIGRLPSVSLYRIEGEGVYIGAAFAYSGPGAPSVAWSCCMAATNCCWRSRSSASCLACNCCCVSKLD